MVPEHLTPNRLSTVTGYLQNSAASLMVPEHTMQAEPGLAPGLGVGGFWVWPCVAQRMLVRGSFRSGLGRVRARCIRAMLPESLRRRTLWIELGCGWRWR